MQSLYGFILIDPAEIVIRIYQSVEEGNWQPLYTNHYQLCFADAKVQETIKVLEVIANVFSDVSGLGVGEWRIYARCMEQKTVVELTDAVGIKVELLTQDQEYELIFLNLLKLVVN